MGWLAGEAGRLTRKLERAVEQRSARLESEVEEHEETVELLRETVQLFRSDGLARGGSGAAYPQAGTSGRATLRTPGERGRRARRDRRTPARNGAALQIGRAGSRGKRGGLPASWNERSSNAPHAWRARSKSTKRPSNSCAKRCSS